MRSINITTGFSFSSLLEKCIKEKIMISMKVLKNYPFIIVFILIILVFVYIVQTDRPFYLISNFHFNLVEESKDLESAPKVNQFLKSISQSANKN